MYTTSLLLHSIVRYFFLIFLLVTVVRSFQGWRQNKAYEKVDDKLGVWLVMLTHTQFILGLLLYFISPVVIFNKGSMSNPVARYWLVEHITLMVVAVILITVARATAKRINEPALRHKRMFTLTSGALVCVLLALLSLKDRGFFDVTM